MPPEQFDARWLALREPVDHRSRPDALVRRFVTEHAGERRLRVLDLGTGTGSNLRYLGSRLDCVQEWTLVDHDRSLLQAVTAPPEVSVVTPIQTDVSELAHLDFGQTDLVTASALLDLVSQPWLEKLVESCRRNECPALLALTYDGSIEWSSSQADTVEEDDELVRTLVNQHQRVDKGFGPALGPLAGPLAESLFRTAGYRTWSIPSPWRLTSADAALARALVAGWESAATSVDGQRAERVRAWALRRGDLITTGAFELTIGHADLLAMPS